MMLHANLARARAHAQREANGRGQQWAVYRNVATYLAAPLRPSPGFPFPGGADRWLQIESVMPSRWDR